MWFLRRSRRTRVDVRHRNVRPALEILESRFAPAGPTTSLPSSVNSEFSPQAYFADGVNFANLELADAGSSVSAHLAVDMGLFSLVRGDINKVSQELPSIGAELQSAIASGNAAAVSRLAGRLVADIWDLSFDMGVLAVIGPDLTANLQRVRGQSNPFAPFGLPTGGLGGGGLGGGFGGGGLGGFGQPTGGRLPSGGPGGFGGG
jgi:hypothetical protein